MPWRRLASAASGERMKSSIARTASARSEPGHRPAEKVVMNWIGSGSVPSTSMPGRCISSLSCWKPSSTSPRATSEPTGTPGGACTMRPLDLLGDAPALEQLRQVHAAGPGGVARGCAPPARPGARRPPSRCRAAARRRARRSPPASAPGRPGCRRRDGPTRSGGRSRRRPARTTSKGSPACTRLAASTPPTDSIATATPLRCVVGRGQLGQHLARGHRRDAGDRGRHGVDPGLGEAGPGRAQFVIGRFLGSAAVSSTLFPH